MGSLFQELKRRNVFKVGAAYLVLGWLIIEIAATVFPQFAFPLWTNQFVTLLVILGFPIAVFFAWAFEVTPEGIKRESDVNRDDSIAAHTGRKLDFLIIGILAVALGYFVYESRFVEDSAMDDTELLADETVELVEDEITGPNEFSIAVLPLVNLSPDPNNAYFAAGIHEEILNQLVKVEQLQVTSRTTVLRFEDSELSIQEIARELNVSMIMEGSVRFAGNQVRITTQLIRASDDVHLWSETYQREYNDIFAIQSDVAIQVASAMNATLSDSELANIERPPTSSTEAYSLYLQAIAEKQSTEAATGIEASANTISLLERAIAIDPAFAQAYSFLAFRKFTTGMLDVALRSDMQDEALYYANKAIEIDPNLAQAYMVLHRVYWSEKQWDLWLYNARKSVELPSLNGGTALQLAGKLSSLGQHEAAYHWSNIAISKSPENEDYLLYSAVTRLYGGDYESSLALSDQYLDLGGREDDYHAIRALVYHFLERDADSLIELNQIQQTPFTLELMGYPEYLRCQTAAREPILQEIGIPTEVVSFTRLLNCALGASDLDTVFDILDLIIQGNLDAADIVISPVFNEARQDPRWQAVEEYMDLPVLTDIQIPY